MTTLAHSATTRRHRLSLEKTVGASLFVIGTFLNLTLLGLVVGMPLAVAGFALLTTPGPS